MRSGFDIYCGYTAEFERIGAIRSGYKYVMLQIKDDR
mgnify:FL=1